MVHKSTKKDTGTVEKSQYSEKREEIAAFLQGIADKHDYIKVILTGAGTSAYVGDTLLPYFKEVYD